jgi:pimeloyl-ACP methyl ester carboxylesterase
MSTLPPLPELKFAAIPAGARGRYSGDRFSYMEAGKAVSPPLVLLHGVGANSMYWRFQFAGLGDGYRVIAWNAPGYMLSDHLVEDAPGCRAYADALADFADALDLARFRIVGNSFGTRVAQCFAHHHPGRAIKIALSGTGIVRRGMTEAARAEIIAGREGQIEAGGYAFGSGRVGALLGPAASAQTIALVREVLRATNKRGFMQAVRFGLGEYETPDFAVRPAFPVLLIQGSADTVNPLETNAAILAGTLPDCRLRVLEGCGHLPEIEAPAAVNALLREFLAD